MLDLGSQPPADAFPTQAEIDAGEPAWPLVLVVCRSCRLVQLADSPDLPEQRAAELLSPPLSTTMQAHRAAVASRVAELVRERGGAVLDLASHGGNLAGELAAAGVASTIVDPDRTRVARLRAAGHAARSLDEGPRDAAVIVDSYFISHTRRPIDLLRGLHRIAVDDARLIVETEYAAPLLEAGRFDSARHGHFSYFSLRSLDVALRLAGWQAVDASVEPVYGGALRVQAASAESAPEPTPRLRELRAAESAAGLDGDATYLAFSARATSARQRLIELLLDARRKGRRVAAYGAGSRASTILNVLALPEGTIEFSVDADPAKQGRLMPGSHVPIAAPAELERQDVDDVLLLAWDLVDEIVPTLPRRAGRRLIVPLPDLRLVDLGAAQRPASRATSGAPVSTSVPSER